MYDPFGLPATSVERRAAVLRKDCHSVKAGLKLLRGNDQIVTRFSTFFIARFPGKIQSSAAGKCRDASGG